MEKSELEQLLPYYEKKFGVYKPSRIVHYCTISTFNKIVEPYITQDSMPRIDDDTGESYEAKYIRFFASDLNFLNDREEYNIGKQYVENASGKLDDPDNPEKLFIACFCNETDNLTQWKYYGKETGTGLAVEFDTNDVLLNYCDRCECGGVTSEKYSQRHDISFLPYKVHYGPRRDCKGVKAEKKIKELDSIVEAALPKQLELNSVTEQTAKVGIIPYIKHEAFEDEKESRITLYQIHNHGKACSSIQYRVGDVIKPFIEMRIFYGNIKAQTKIPIKSITIGPGRDQNLLFRSIYYLMEEDERKKGRNIEEEPEIRTTSGIKIKKSTVPFRS